MDVFRVVLIKLISKKKQMMKSVKMKEKGSDEIVNEDDVVVNSIEIFSEKRNTSSNRHARTIETGNLEW